MPDVIINDKNTKEPSANKTVNKESFSIGDTITYTATFDTANWLGEGADSQQVTKYVISDTLPDFLSEVTVTSIKIDADGNTSTTNDQQALTTQQFDTNNSITIPWVKGTKPNYQSLYANGAKIVITYTAVLTDVTNIDAADTNTVKIQPYTYQPAPGDDDDDDDDDDDQPWEKTWEKDAVIKTYAAALKKTDGSKALSGAKFKFYGLTVTETAAGIYTVSSYDATAYDSEAEEQDDSKLGTEMTVDSNGKLYIIGLASDVTLHGIETKAPDGYNKMDGEVTLTPQQTGEKIIKQSGEIKYDNKGNVISSTNTTTTVKDTINETPNLNKLDAAAVEVVNNKGNELPSTGGIGTTIFYVIGAILVLGAGILLVTRRRMNAN
jgi:LPXTG-motif cell wall-anchored protein